MRMPQTQASTRRQASTLPCLHLALCLYGHNILLFANEKTRKTTLFVACLKHVQTVLAQDHCSSDVLSEQLTHKDKAAQAKNKQAQPSASRQAQAVSLGRVIFCTCLPCLAWGPRHASAAGLGRSFGQRQRVEGAVWPKTWSDFSILVKVVCNWHHISVLGDLGRSSVIISVPKRNLIALE